MVPALKVPTNQQVIDHCLIQPFPAGKAINYKSDKTAFIMHWRVVPVRVEGKIVFWLAIQREAGTI